MLDVRPPVGGLLPPGQVITPAVLQEDQQLILWRPPEQQVGGFRARLVASLLLLLLLLGLMSVAVTSLLLGPTSAIVSITPQYRASEAVTTILAKAVQITGSERREATVPATGKGQQPARRAAGVLTLYNLAPFAQTIPEESIITGESGIPIATDSAVTVHAGNPPVEAWADVGAHALTSGAAGNIPTEDIKAVPCCTNLTLQGVVVTNRFPFQGGQDLGTFTVVGQRDVDTAAAPLEAAALPVAQKSVQEQVPANLQLSPTLSCTTLLHAAPAVGSRSAQVVVTVIATCRGQAYDQSAVLQAARDEFMSAHQPVPGYRLFFTRAAITSVTAASSSNGTLSCAVLVTGRWLYQFDRRALAAIKETLAGLSYSQAQAALQKEAGVRQATIHLSAGSVIPADAGQITIIIEPPA